MQHTAPSSAQAHSLAPSSIDASTITAALDRKLKRMREDLDDISSQTAAKIVSLQSQIKEISTEVDNIDATVKSQLQSQLQDLEHQQKKVQQEQNEWQRTQAKIRRVSPGAPRKVTLNVGGQRHETSVDTLTNEKDTYFAVMFSDQFASPVDEKGEVFIDRDPRHFCIILNHMRGMDVCPMIEKLDKHDLEMLKQDVDFYQIESLKDLLGMNPVKWTLDENYKASIITLIKNSDDSVTVKRNPGGCDWALVLGNTGFSSGVHEWQIRCDTTSADQIILGVCKRKEAIEGSFYDCSVIWGRCSQGYKCNPKGDYDKYIYRAWYNGTIVSFKLDCDAGKLTVDDCTLDVPHHEELFPVLALVNPEDSVTLMPL